MCAWGKPKGPSFTTKLSRTLGDLKRKRKAIAAHRSATITPSLSSHKPSQFPPPHHFTSHTSPPTSFTTSPLQSTTSSPPGSAHSHPTHVDASCPATITPQESSSRSIRPPYTAEKEALPSNPSPLSSPAAPHSNCGKHLAQRVLWAAPLFALLGTFLCIGKEIAFAGAVAVHLILWLALRLGLLARGSNVIIINHTAPHSCRQEGEDSIAEENRKLHSSLQDDGRSGIAGESDDFPSRKCAGIAYMPQRGRVSAKLKLQVVLLFAICGLFHGRIVAVCMALCYILIHSTMKSLC